MTNAGPPQMSPAPPTPNRWPTLPVSEWAPTRDTLQLWTQVVGKVRLANTPTINHWWNVTLYVSARGLTTSLIPHAQGPCFQIDFDLQDHQLQVVTTANEHRSFQLESLSVAEFYTRLMSQLDELGVGTMIWPMPVEIEGAVAFTRGPRPRGLRPRPGAPFLAASGAGLAGVPAVPQRVHRQVQPGPSLLGGVGPGRHTLFRTNCAAASWRSPELWARGHARGLLPRGE